MRIPVIMQLSSHLGCHGTGVMKKTSEGESEEWNRGMCCVVVVVFLNEKIRVLDNG